MRNVSLVRRGRELLRDFNWTLPDPGLYLLLGGTGAGKSLLSRMLAGRCKPGAGRVLIDGQPLYRWLLGYQDPVWLAAAELELTAPETVEEHLEIELRNAGASLEGLADVWPRLEPQLPGGRKARMEELSHGQQLLVQVALAGCHQTRLAILDGHLTYLDRPACAVVADLLAVAAAQRDRFILLTAGRVAWEFPAALGVFRLQGGFPLQIAPVAPQAVFDTALQPVERGSVLRFYFAGPNYRHFTVASCASFSVLSKLEDGLRIKLEGSLDQVLGEFARLELRPQRIEWESPAE